ncbi:MAG TPA: Lrp/AsnC family transcriptional regulator [Nitrososphaeria archaeon]|nr:Lrp/AsnC family transcriptional regulator [Conexivisphaerales archaeon]PMP95554.1 MAG: transcriptional regulator [Nitrososphaera sp.]HEU16213.1 Lrp/AsnC family transcriptional regulator [Nitrososphaeria archaeon]
MPSDDIDSKIIGMLKADARKPFVEIAKELGISEAAVRRRVRKLVESGTIKKFTIELGRLGGASAITLVAVEPGAQIRSIAERVRALDGVDRVYEITGQYDMAIFVGGESITDVNSTIDKIRSMDGVVSTNTVIILKED